MKKKELLEQLDKIQNEVIEIVANRNLDYIDDLDMLDKVVSFKMKFYPRKWAKYEDVKLGEIRLVPPAYRLELLKKDYLSMQEMIYGEYPSFEKLIEYIKKLEEEIHFR